MKKNIIFMVLMLTMSACTKTEEEIPVETVDVLEEVTQAEKEKIITHIEEDKQETVYVTADAYGDPTKVEAEIVLKAEGNEPVEDYTRLSDIRNTRGDETFTLEDKHLIFENKGEDIHYKGLSSDPLPVTVTISYYLDGKKIKAEDLAGQSGHLKMRFDYKNNTMARKDGYELIIPFMALSVVMLDEEVFSNVKTENARIMEYNGNKIALIAAFPGLEDALKLSSLKLSKDIHLDDFGIIEADVRDFKLDYTATVLSKNIFSDLEEDDLSVIDDLADKTDGLSDTDELTEATAKLLDACITLQDGLITYTSAVSTLNDSIGTVLEGANGLADGLKQIKENLPDDEQCRQLSEAIEKQIEDIRQTASVFETNLNDMAQNIAVLKTLINGSEEEDIEAIELKEKDRDSINKQISRLENDLARLSVLGFNDLDALITSLSQNIESLSLLTASVSALSDGANQLTAGLSQIKEGSQTLQNYGCNVNLAAKELVKAAREFDDKVNEFVNEGLDELEELGGTSLKDISARTKALKKIDKEYGCFTGLLEGKKGSTTFIIETASIK